MITYLILSFLVSIVGILFSLFPIIEELPWGVDSFLASGVSTFKAMSTFFPPFETLLSCALIYVSFRMGLLVIKFFLGSRVPSHG